MHIGPYVLPPMVVVLVACASSGSPATTANTESDPATSSRGAELSQAATTPLADLNLVRAKIPPVLSAAPQR